MLIITFSFDWQQKVPVVHFYRRWQILPFLQASAVQRGSDLEETFPRKFRRRLFRRRVDEKWSTNLSCQRSPVDEKNIVWLTHWEAHFMQIHLLGWRVTKLGHFCPSQTSIELPMWFKFNCWIIFSNFNPW